MCDNSDEEKKITDTKAFTLRNQIRYIKNFYPNNGDLIKSNHIMKTK